MTNIFVDTDALVAVHDGKDASHKKALHILEEISILPHVLYTSLNILLEALTMISQRVSKEYAISVLDELRSGKYIVIHPDEQTIAQAEDIFRAIKSKNVSYSDCVSFAVMRRYGIERVFSFDIHFKKMGFKRIGIDK